MPAPGTLAELITIAQQIAKQANGQIYGWRGQSCSDWAVHSGGIRRVMRPWVRPFSADRRTVQELIKQLLPDESSKDQPRDDDDPNLWMDMRSYHRYLINEARIRGFDHHDGIKLNELELLALLQHHGAATHLLDISRDMLTSLRFAANSHPEHTGILVAFDDSDMQTLSANKADTSFDELMVKTTEDTHSKVFGWVPRNLTPRVLAQRSLFLLSGYADQPWGTIQINGTYVWQSDRDDPDEPLLQLDDARAYFVAIPPSLKAEVVDAGKAGILGVDARSFFPDLAGFAKENNAGADVPLLPLK